MDIDISKIPDKEKKPQYKHRYTFLFDDELNEICKALEALESDEKKALPDLVRDALKEKFKSFLKAS